MNDRFKFRGYHPVIGEVMDISEIDYHKRIAYFTDGDGFNIDEVKLMQCTGLKDKNGKLIYEGNIIQIQGCTENAKVEYNLEKGMFLLVGKKYAPSAFMTIRKDYWEVIGNIYENKELLNE